MMTDMGRRPIEWWERRRLENNGCRAEDWNKIRISDGTDLNAIRNVTFIGAVSLGILREEEESCIIDATLENVTVGDYARIEKIGIAVRNCSIGNRARVLDTSLIDFEPEAMCGVGCKADVLDETGGRAVTIYPGLSSQTAMMMARLPKWNERHFEQICTSHCDSLSPIHEIGEGALVQGCGTLVNVSVGREVEIVGARSLRNGTIVNNAAPGRALSKIGAGVDAENFILEDGVIDSGAIVRNCYVGQGATLEKGFTAHDSLFFANCSLENGEACALFAGPYTVSMHKSSLLIGCQTSFLNAGSGSNQSNHMYKLGPVHWGVLERGVKTSSDSYLMLGAKIGAFSLLMGQHKTHPDSSEFPFSYLFGDDRGATVVVPGVMLRSCGLMRDENKWPARDRRQKRRLPLHDRIIFNVLNPLTVDRMISAREVIDTLLSRPADDDRFVRYRGMKFSRASLERARQLYYLAICKYLYRILGENGWEGLEKDCESGDVVALADEWVDMGGLPITRSTLEKAQKCESVEEMEELWSTSFEQYPKIERGWIAARIPKEKRFDIETLKTYASEFDKMLDEDRARYLEDLRNQNDMLAL